MLGTNATISVYPLEITATIDSFAVIASVVAEEAYIESVSSDLAQALDQDISIERFYCYTDPIVINKGDKVVDNHGVEYRVIGIERHENNTDTDDLYLTILHKK